MTVDTAGGYRRTRAATGSSPDWPSAPRWPCCSAPHWPGRPDRPAPSPV